MKACCQETESNEQEPRSASKAVWHLIYILLKTVAAEGCELPKRLRQPLAFDGGKSPVRGAPCWNKPPNNESMMSSKDIQAVCRRLQALSDSGSRLEELQTQ